MPDLSARSAEPEWMDDPAIDPAVFAALLGDLARVNSWTLARPPTLAWLARATAHLKRGERFSLLDVGYGHGDMLRAIHRFAARRGLVAELSGIDLSPWSEPAARAATPEDMRIIYRTGDIFEMAAGERPDFIISSLVAHHMPDEMVVRFLRWMEASAGRGWFVNDLHRHKLAYWGFGLLARVMRWHPFVVHDGMLSVARSFRRADWERLIAAAGLSRAAVTLRWHMPFRLCAGRLR